VDKGVIIQRAFGEAIVVGGSTPAAPAALPKQPAAAPAPKQ
jgi:hypothetical protein